MAKGCRGRRRVSSGQERHAPYQYRLPNCKLDASEGACAKTCHHKPLPNDWQDATCSVCMESPHNAFLLLCSSHDKGCRPYMCGTSLRFSNCLDQYKKAYTKVASLHNQPSEKCETTELACPLCRGQVRGWAVVEPARKHLNSKQRSCMQDGCSFTGTYKELRRHVRSEHPYACPWEVDSFAEQKWRQLEREREQEDVISTIRSSIPGAVVYGDYVIEGNDYDSESDDDDEGGFRVGNEGSTGEFGVGFDGSNLVNIITFLRALSPNSNSGYHRRLIRASRGGRTTEYDSVNSLNTVSEEGSSDMISAEVAATVHDTPSEPTRRRHVRF